MDVVYRCCAGLDVHKDQLRANLLRRGVAEQPDLNEVRSFQTMTEDLLSLCDWLKGVGCTHVAMESTGVYWKPIFNILESEFEVVLVNARHIKNVPGRKTDVKDCQWIAQLLQHGLLQGSFIPPKAIRELRDLTRQRRRLVQQRTTVGNRIQKVLEDANIKLGSVASHVMSKSGIHMIEALVRGETDPTKLAHLAQGRLRSKIPELRRALYGHITDHHRFLLRQHLRQIRFLDQLIEEFDEQIDQQVRPFFDLVPLIATVPGINEISAKEIIAEIGVNMSQFPNQHHLASWAGMAPGNNESAGKRKSGKTTEGSKWLRATLAEVAWGAGRTKHTYLAARYRRLVTRRGKKRAIVAIGHMILTVVYHIIKDRTTYFELGEDFYERNRSNQLRRYYTKRLARLGYTVQLTRAEEDAA